MVAATAALLLIADYSILSDEAFTIERDLHELPSARSWAVLLENVAHPAIFQLEESAGFADADRAKVSIYGSSWLWTRWTLDGAEIGDPLEDGAPVANVPFRFASQLAITHQGTTGVAFTSGPRPGAAAWAHVPEVGDIWPLAIPIMNAISGIHSRERQTPPPATRRHEDGGFRLELADRDWAVEARGGSRFFNRFAPAGTFDERYLIVSGAIRIGDGFVLAEHRQRENLFAEIYHAPEETAAESSTALVVTQRFGEVQAGLTLLRRAIDHNQLGHTRDVVDFDGESLFPFFPEGEHLAARGSLSFEAGTFYARAGERLLAFLPETERWTNPLVFAGRPIGRIDFSTRDVLTAIGEARFGLRESQGDTWRFHYDVSLVGSHADDLAFLDGEARIHGAYHGWRGWRWFAELAKTPVPITTQLARALEPGYLTGRRHLADGRLVETSGGDFIRVAPGLAQTNVYSIVLGVSHRLGGAWTLRAQGDTKFFANIYRLEYDGPLPGVLEDRIFFPAEGEKRYRLVNADGIYAYWGGHIQLLHESERLIFGITFSAFNAIGRTPFGNGPGANDLGLIHESTANPNNDLLGLANTDNDRAFVTRLLFGWSFVDRAWLWMTFSHKDGQPFSLIEEHARGGDVAFTYDEHRGSPLHYLRPLIGPREDFRINVDLQLAYSFDTPAGEMRATVLGSNVLDFGNEINESNDPAIRGARPALEAEIPRSLWFGLELSR